MREDELDAFQGCLAGGAMGAALGAASGTGRRGVPTGPIPGVAQLTLVTAEGLIRAYVRDEVRGLVSIESVIHHAYLRWANLNGLPLPCELPPADGWLAEVPEMKAGGKLDPTSRKALTSARWFTDAPKNRSKSPAAVVRVAPVGLFCLRAPERAFDLAARIARLTHGHPTAYLSAALFASVIARVAGGERLRQAIAASMSQLQAHKQHEEVTRAVEGALAASGAARYIDTGHSQEARCAAAALACALSATLRTQSIAEAMQVADETGALRPYASAMAGALAGAIYGRLSIPGEWASTSSLAPIAERLATDLFEAATGRLEAEVAGSGYPGD